VGHEAECQLYVARGVIIPNVLDGLISCKERESDMLLSVARDTTEEAVARGRRLQGAQTLRGAAMRDAFGEGQRKLQAPVHPELKSAAAGPPDRLRLGNLKLCLKTGWRRP
jgi:hypothetical protein